MNPMIVDDEPAIREIFSLFISRGGHTPYTAASGRECLDLLRTVTPDIIMLDIMMEPMDGWDTLTAIRTTAATADLPVTMFSGKPPAIAELRQYGKWIDDYLMKPLEFKNLPSTLAGIIERSRLQNDAALVLKKSAPDPLLAGEYRALQKNVFMFRKFAGTFRDDDFEAAIRIQEDRMQQIRAYLHGYGTDEKPAERVPQTLTAGR